MCSLATASFRRERRFVYIFEISFAKMSAIYNYLRAVAIVVAFIAAKQSKKAAWSFDLILTAWFGMGCFLFPQTVVSKVCIFFFY